MRPVDLERRKQIAIACLACLAVGPTCALAVALHSLEHDGPGHHHAEVTFEEPPGAAHQEEVTEGRADHHSHDLPPPALDATPPFAQSRVVMVAAVGATGAEVVSTAESGRGLPVATAAHDPPAPPGLFVLRL